MDPVGGLGCMEEGARARMKGGWADSRKSWILLEGSPEPAWERAQTWGLWSPRPLPAVILPWPS